MLSENMKQVEQVINIKSVNSFFYRNQMFEINRKSEDSVNLSVLIHHTYTEDTNIFPSDDQVNVAVFEKALSNKYTREILYIISLYDLDDPKTDNHSLSLEGFSLEHLMPKKWKNNWEIPD